MTTFRTTWVMDVDADGAREAARKARDYQLRPHGQVGLFEVTDGQGRVFRVDLDEQDEREQYVPQLPAWIQSVRPIEDEAALLGSVYILGTLHHAWFVQVVDEGGDRSR